MAKKKSTAQKIAPIIAGGVAGAAIGATTVAMMDEDTRDKSADLVKKAKESLASDENKK